MKQLTLTEQVDKALSGVCDAALKYAGIGALVAVQTLQKGILDGAQVPENDNR